MLATLPLSARTLPPLHAARIEAAEAIAPIVTRRSRIERAIDELEQGADPELAGDIERLRDHVAILDAEVAESLRRVALRHRLFVREDETESFDDVDTDAITPAAELARIRWTAARKGR